MLEKYGYVLVDLAENLTISKVLTFKDSVYVSRQNIWYLNPTVKKQRSKKVFELGKASGHLKEWLELTKFIETLIPKILYFKNEVFDFPNRIYLTVGQSDDEDVQPPPVNQFYCEVIQDILYAIKPDLNLQKHVIDRQKSGKVADKQALEGLLQKIGQHVTQTVMKQWESIFSRPLKEKRIRARCEINEFGQVYFQLQLEDGGEIFDIKERSTGFRWFFVFILLTQYRGHRNEAAIFLYDEPASNLHSAAQQQLLKCFADLPENFTVIYSTHSHYLINPHWLDSTMVVRNEAANEDSLENIDSAKTDIRLLPYKKFVSDNPSSINYFQPILDLLQYLPSELEAVKPSILVEGKSDFYTISYFSKICLGLELKFDIIPCLGSGTADQLIALYAGWGKDFYVLLDSDKAGRKEKIRYEEKFGSLVSGRIFCYGDIDPTWEKQGLEKIIGTNDLAAIQAIAFPGSKYKKDKVHLAIQQLHAQRKATTLSTELSGKISKIITFFDILLLAG